MFLQSKDEFDQLRVETNDPAYFGEDITGDTSEEILFHHTLKILSSANYMKFSAANNFKIDEHPKMIVVGHKNVFEIYYLYTNGRLDHDGQIYCVYPNRVFSNESCEGGPSQNSRLSGKHRLLLRVLLRRRQYPWSQV